MNLPELVARMSLPITAGISLLLARRVPSYRPVAETLFLGACFDLARGNVSGTILDPPLLLAFPCLSASLSLKVFAKLPRWPVGLAWGVLAGLTLLPVSRAFLEPLGRVYGVVHVVGLLAQIFGIWRWTRRHNVDSNHRQWLRETNRSVYLRTTIPTQIKSKNFAFSDFGSKILKEESSCIPGNHASRDALRKVSDRSDTFAPFAVLILFAGDLAALFGPFAAGDPRRDWYVANAQTILLFLVFNVWQVCKFRQLRGKSG